MSWPQPYEGITGTNRDDWLLALDDKALAHRDALIVMARHLGTATLVGQPAPVVRAISQRIRHPEPGDLVVETSRALYSRGAERADDRLKGLGILIARRREWAESDTEWVACREEWQYADNDRGTEDAIYIQYGPSAGDICRWVNADIMTLPVHIDSLSVPAGYRDDSATVFTRDSLISSLADSGFQLRDPGTPPA